MKDHRKIAGDLFLEGYNCAQAVFAAFCDVTGYEKETALKISSSFGGGMGRMREVCGALSGAFMVAGVLWGSDALDDKEKAAHYARIQAIAQPFKDKYDTILCRDLMKDLKVDSSPVPTVRDAAFYQKRPCLQFVEYAAQIVDEMIEEKQHNK